MQALGYLSREDGARCLEELAEAERAGRALRLAQILLQRKLVTSVDMVTALKPEKPPGQPRKTTATRQAYDLAALGEAVALPAKPAPGAPGDPAPGERLGAYELVRELARGGMGILFEAQRPDAPGERFALKVLTARAGAHAHLVARFRQEAELTASLDHPNIVKVREVGAERGRPFIVMDYFDGRSLAELLKEGRLSPKKAVEVVGTVARAAEYMHAQQVLHRDLKPANILVGKKGNVAVTDFGLAKDLARSDAVLTQVGIALGTPAYMAPEQARGELDRIGPWSDVYSLGATLYRSLAGTYPHDADSVVAAVQKIAREEPVSLQKRRPDVPAELAAIVGTAMARDPRARPTAGELAARIEAFLASGPLLMPPAPPNPKV